MRADARRALLQLRAAPRRRIRAHSARHWPSLSSHTDPSVHCCLCPTHSRTPSDWPPLSRRPATPPQPARPALSLSACSCRRSFPLRSDALRPLPFHPRLCPSLAAPRLALRVVSGRVPTGSTKGRRRTATDAQRREPQSQARRPHLPPVLSGFVRRFLRCFHSPAARCLSIPMSRLEVLRPRSTGLHRRRHRAGASRRAAVGQ